MVQQDFEQRLQERVERVFGAQLMRLLVLELRLEMAEAARHEQPPVKPNGHERGQKNVPGA